MARKHIDCRENPGEIKCSLVLSADSEEELLEAAVEHMTARHNYQDTSEGREMLRKKMKDGNPLK